MFCWNFIQVLNLLLSEDEEEEEETVTEELVVDEDFQPDSAEDEEKPLNSFKKDLPESLLMFYFYFTLVYSKK